MTCFKVSSTRGWAGLSVIKSCDRVIRKVLLLWMFGPPSRSSQPLSSKTLDAHTHTYTHTQCAHTLSTLLSTCCSPKIITQWNPTAHSVIPATILHTHLLHILGEYDWADCAGPRQYGFSLHHKVSSEVWNELMRWHVKIAYLTWWVKRNRTVWISPDSASVSAKRCVWYEIMKIMWV